jgi:prephenate dehydratase
VHGHVIALGQCRKAIRALKLKPVTETDTGGAARQLRESGDRTAAVIASSLAAEIYGLRVAKADIEDAEHNTTHFVVLAVKAEPIRKGAGPVITSFVFRVRDVPAALYKALGGFATNGVNMTKLESYQLKGSFNATMFYADIEGHPDERPVKLAMEELHFFSSEVTVLGTYPASPFRAELKAAEG